MTSAALKLPVGLDHATFLARFWQKQALFLPSALPGITPPFAPENLTALVEDPDIESRLVWIEDGHWHLHPGPFGADVIDRLDGFAWTVLVQDVEKHFPSLRRFLRPFSFLPSWRIEDLMLSYATTGGGVGPHVDNYDVFLVQASGRRRWQIDSRNVRPRIKDHAGLRQLDNFETTESWEAVAGDVLYLPPGVPHCGTALADEDPCMTLSVGLRAPGADELLHALAEGMAATPDAVPRYTDPDLVPAEATPGLISATALGRVRELLRRGSDLADRELAVCFGKLVTEPKEWLTAEAREEVVSAAALRERAAHGVGVTRHPFAHLAWSESDAGLDFFFDGEHMLLGNHLQPLVLSLCRDDGKLSAEKLIGWLNDMLATEVILHLLSIGKLIYEDE